MIGCLSVCLSSHLTVAAVSGGCATECHEGRRYLGGWSPSSNDAAAWGHGTAFSSKCRQYHDDSHIEEAQLRLVVTIVAVCLFTVGGGSVHLSCATC